MFSLPELIIAMLASFLGGLFTMLCVYLGVELQGFRKIKVQAIQAKQLAEMGMQLDAIEVKE